jgi:predicted DNA-binding transcriptional regulator YafY
VCRDDERIEVVYRAADGERTERLAEPHRLVLLGRRWYLVAYDLTRHDWRSFRVDRIESLVNTGVRFRQKRLPAKDAATFVRAGIQTAPSGHSIVAVIDAPATDVEASVGRWATVESLDGGRRAVLRMTADDLDWPALALGSLDADFDIVEPPELVDHLAGWAKRFRRARLVDHG